MSARAVGISGLVSVVLFGIAAALLFDLPAFSDSTTVTQQYFEDAGHVSLIRAGAYMWGCLTMAVMVWFSTFSAYLRKQGAPAALCEVASVSGYVIFAMSLMMMSLVALATFSVNEEDYVVIKPLLNHGQVITGFTGFPTMISNACYSLAMFSIDNNKNSHSRGRGRVAWRALAAVGLLIGLLHMVSAGAFQANGFLSPSGLGQFVCAPLYFVWILFVSVHLWVLSCRPDSDAEGHADSRPLVQ